MRSHRTLCPASERPHLAATSSFGPPAEEQQTATRKRAAEAIEVVGARCLQTMGEGWWKWAIQIRRRVGSAWVNSAHNYPKGREEGGGTSWWHQLSEQPLTAGGLSTEPFPPLFRNYSVRLNSSVFLKGCIYSNVKRKQWSSSVLTQSPKVPSLT